MIRRFKSCAAVIAAFLVALAASAPAGADARLAQKVQTAEEVFRELLATPDHEVPDELLKRARCVAVMPGVVKGAFGWGGKHGRGVLSCRDGKEGWSAPVFVRISGGSFGFQVGAQAADVVLFLMSERSVKSLLKSQFTLGGDVSVAAGPLGRSAEASTDARLKAEIYSYAKSRGLFAGISVEGSRLAPHKKSMVRYYGRPLDARAILIDHEMPDLPSEAKSFLAALP
ncbi:MAG: lipid-binding SYLF domain-containing protein [bacterium]|nr:lipid-binding SYLF domain-containing protein [bacterium]